MFFVEGDDSYDYKVYDFCCLLADLGMFESIMFFETRYGQEVEVNENAL